MIKQAFALIVVLMLNTGFSKTVIITDIDDTVKNAHILDTFDMLKNGLFTEGLYFEGMDELYHMLIKTDKLSSIEYLTNAKSWLMSGSHGRFIRNGNYPSGQIFFRKDLSSEEHKPYYLRRIIEILRPDRVILIGDNGQHDALFYHELINDYKESEIKFLSFIRVAYSTEESPKSSPLFDEQTGFSTPIEIMAKLIDVNIIDKAVGTKYIEKMNNSLKLNPLNFFPEWINCENLTWPALKTPLVNKSYLEAKSIILKRCSSI